MQLAQTMAPSGHTKQWCMREKLRVPRGGGRALLMGVAAQYVMDGETAALGATAAIAPPQQYCAPARRRR